MGKKIMMVGAGSCQINGIKSLKAQGHKVIVADYSETSMGKSLADIAVLADAFKADEILESAREYAVDAVITMGTDQPLLPVVKTAETLGLPRFITSETAYAVTNKREMKRIFKEKNIPTVPFALVKKGFDVDEIAHITPPYVMKPIDSQGQRGIFLVETPIDIRLHFDDVLAHSREDEILIEAYYENEEITVSGWVVKGDAKVLTITDRVTFTPSEHIGVCVAHEYPSKFYPFYADEFHRLTQRICDAFSIEDGPIYFQMLVGNKGVMVNEIACRLGGAFEDVTIPYVTGVDILKCNIDGAFGNLDIDKDLIEKIKVNETNAKEGTHKYFSTQLFFCRPGKVADQTNIKKLMALPYILEVGYNFKTGDMLMPIETASQRAGYMIVTGESEEELTDHIERAYETLKWRDADGNNLVIKRSRNEREVSPSFLPKR